MSAEIRRRVTPTIHRKPSVERRPISLRAKRRSVTRPTGWSWPPLFAALTESIVLLTGAVMDAPRGGGARREERYPLTCALQISWQRASGETCTARATCQDVSLRGARVECSEPIMTRSSVYLSAPSYGLMGNATVRYCRRKGLKYAIGLEFTWAAALAEEGRKRMSPGS
jgi:hypothetical protein